MSKSIIFTLFEGNYDYGVGALINSAHKSGFKGKIVIGYKGALPFWFEQLKESYGNYLLPDREDLNIEVIFKEVTVDYHLRYFKPTMFKNIFAEHPDAKVYYFDPDIIIIGNWSFFEEWVEYGVACVLDENFPYMPYNHPLKNKWAEIFGYKLNSVASFNFYINSGFIGCRVKDIDLINDWENNIKILDERGGNLKTFAPVFTNTLNYKRLNSIIGDQDVLNATINKDHTSYNLTIVGPDGMGFTPPGYLMYHNTGKKTWNKNVLLEFIKYGNKISIADDLFLLNCLYPLTLYSNLKLNLKKLNFFSTKIFQRIF